MFKYLKIFFLILIINLVSYAQPDIRVDPNKIVFKDIFNRIEYTTIINRGDQPLVIDSLEIKRSFYIIDFQDGKTLPFTLNPDDSIKMNITLSYFYSITVSDTLDTLYIHSNDSNSPEDLRIKIDFFDDDDRGICSGIIRDEALNPIQDAAIYFLYDGIYLLDSSKTDVNGNYTTSLPKGSYTLAAEKEGYRTMFYGNTPDPFYAYPIVLDSGETVNLSLSLPPLNNVGFTLSGMLFDSVSNNPINKGVVIIRKGNHTPTLLKPTNVLMDSSIYAAFVKPDGTFELIVEDSSYYLLQGFSDYFLPSYYSVSGNSTLFWQDADSILINSQIVNKNLYLERDSSYGGGKASGSITVPLVDRVLYDGITIMARSVSNGALYSYNFGNYDGSFQLGNLPYGTYELVAQKIGFPNAVSEQFVIDSLRPQTSNLILNFDFSSVDENSSGPDDFTLNQNYPNPFNPSTTITFNLTKQSNVRLMIYNMLGQQIITLVDAIKNPGEHSLIFNASNLASGVYFYSIQLDNNSLVTRKMLLIK
jgi:hypothetical protein